MNERAMRSEMASFRIRIMIGLLVFLGMLGMLSVRVHAAEWCFYIGNDEITTDGPVTNEQIKKGSVTLDRANKTLTLDNATIDISKDGKRRGISATRGLTIVLKGTNEITGPYYGIRVLSGDLTLKGNGSLEMTTVDEEQTANSIYAEEGGIKIDGVEVTAKSNWCGIGSYKGDILITNGAKVNATGVSTENIWGYGISAALGSITIENGSTVYAKEFRNSLQIACDNIYIKDSGLTADGRIFLSGEEGSKASGLYVSGASEVTVIGGVDGGIFNGLHVTPPTNGTVTIKMGDQEDGSDATAYSYTDEDGNEVTSPFSKKVNITKGDLKSKNYLYIRNSENTGTTTDGQPTQNENDGSHQTDGQPTQNENNGGHQTDGQPSQNENNGSNQTDGQPSQNENNGSHQTDGQLSQNENNGSNQTDGQPTQNEDNGSNQTDGQPTQNENNGSHQTDGQPTQNENDGSNQLVQTKDDGSYKHHHVYEWETYKAATATTDGIMRYRCKTCGTVEYEVPTAAYYVFNKDAQETIKNAAADATVAVSTEIFISFHKMVEEALNERPDVTLVVDYENAGKSYEMTIPAGSGETLNTLFGEDQFAGFLYLGGAFATVEQ